ncbi:MAG: crosslink repair DNA glycosylase YcaQ family protein [Acidimicrobiia bacterium]|nr:crosslink repair DNA glycosylase YcaQ family protein [Acidimicrobiia bacterium]
MAGSVLELFSPATRAWFESSFPAPTAAQTGGWPAIASGSHTLIHAPTGSGKTLAAFLATIDALLHEPEPEANRRLRVLYVSPLKALAYDIDRNLRAPLVGIRHSAERLGLAPLPRIETFLRTGDTPAAERRRMQRTPPDILITTPESLYLLLTSQARETLRSVRWVICDEVHAIAGTKRGAHFALSLERLEDLTESSPQRIGLSATQRPLETTARFLAGGTTETSGWEPRPVEIVDAAAARQLDIEVVVPVEDMAAPAEPDPLDPEAVRPRSIWPATYPRILDLVKSHRSTIVFANSRRLAERVCAELNELAGEEIARAHHGSVSREQRTQIEEALKRGELRAVVATSSLELGIDMGAVELVVQIESPISVASGLQRVGRAGHQVGATSVAKIFPKYRGDLLLATVVADRMRSGHVEPTVIPQNPLDVLAQQLVAAVVVEDRSSDDLYGTVRRAAPFADLPRSVFDATLDMLAGRYPSDVFAELRPRVVWDRVTGMVSARTGARQLAIANAGTIPDRGLFRVTLPDGSRVGELDEEMVYESRVGDVFVLGASTWKISEIGPDRVEVVPAPGEPAARMPFWHGDSLGRSLETGRAVGAFIRRTAALDAGDAISTLMETYRLDRWAAENLVRYLAEQREATDSLPSDDTIVVERFRDEIGDWRVVILSPLGARVHAPWAMAVTQRLRERYGSDVDAIWSDDGIAFRFLDADEPPSTSDLLLDPTEVEPLLVDHVADTAMFGARFREAAGRALLLPRRRPGSRTPLWLQRRRAADLLGVAKRFGTFPIVLESYREILRDDFDLAGLEEVLTGIDQRAIRVVEVDTRSPSPFASSLLFAFVASYLYEGDTPLAERKAAALTLDRELLAELLGDGELRELLDAERLAELELELQRLTEPRKARHKDAVADLLADLGPLTGEEVEARSTIDAGAALAQLENEHRAMRVRWKGSERWAAVEDAGRLRDALGVQPPPGVAHVFLDPVADPLGDVIARYARTHGPFTEQDVAEHLGLPVGVARTGLQRLEARGQLVAGAFRPGGTGREWIDRNVLRSAKRRSLVALRAEIEPVDAPALGRFLPDWQRVTDDPGHGITAVADAVRTLEGSSLIASGLERDILATRAFDPASGLDRLLTEGEIVWAGRGAVGARDGRVALYTRQNFAALWNGPTSEPPAGEIHDRIRTHLERRGASFFSALYTAAGGGDVDLVLEAVWDLVWAGEVTNDSLEPLRAYVAQRPVRSRGRPTLSGSYPPHAAGRWSLVAHLLEDAGGTPSDTERAAAWTETLLTRHGVVTRPGVLAEGIPGGFAGLYPVLQRMEETGRIRRGYFVEGLGGAQFALPGAVDRLRVPAAGTIRVLAAGDPANPYGAALSWPEIDDGRIGRFAGAYLILADGRLIGFVDGRHLRTFDVDDELRASVGAAIGRVAARHRNFRVDRINGSSVHGSPWASTLSAAGFAATSKGLAYRGDARRR